MLRTSLKNLLLGLAIAPMLAQPVLAHSIWIDKGQKAGELDVLYGHPELNELDKYDSIKFQAVRAYDKTVVSVPVTIQRKRKGVTLIPQRKIAALTAIHDNGYFIRNGNNYRNVFRPEALAANNKQTEISHTYKYAKAFYEASGLTSLWYGLPLEIIPQQDPFSVGVGETLKVLVLLQGKPQQGVTVEYEGTKLTTNKNGVAFVTLKAGNKHVIESEYSTDARDPATDEIGHASSLTIDKRGF